jgi:primosomal protein N' (replication factor Y)
MENVAEEGLRVEECLIAVALPVPVDRVFTYLVPAGLVGKIQVGVRVLVPFGRQIISGFVIGLMASADGELKAVHEVLDDEPLFPAGVLTLYRWVAEYYQHPLGEVIQTALPAGLTVKNRHLDRFGAVRPGDRSSGKMKSERWAVAVAGSEPAAMRGKSAAILLAVREAGELSLAALRERFGACAAQVAKLQQLALISIQEREVYRDPFGGERFSTDPPPQLSPAQAVAVAELTTSLAHNRFAPYLLHGITGSGKTEVYLHAIAVALAAGRTALVLVPEIALTPQLVGRFKRRFTVGIAVLHSGLSAGERYDEWRRICRGEAQIVIGARSAVFAPLERLGIVVVDEEHEASYKQSDGLRYNARDVSLMLGKLSNAVVVLGSATPLVTTWHAVQSGRLGYLELPERVNNRLLPEVQVADLRGRQSELFSPELRTALQDTFSSGGQGLLFLNRRGFATYLLCRDCGEALRCPNCAVTLTYHQGRGRHVCHYCEYAIPAPTLCAACGSGEFALLGKGTERVEEALAALLPAARIARMDRDTTAARGSMGRILRKFEQREIDLLVGTQMIAKGHDFPGVTLVGVVSADEALNVPDFRSAERTFQLVTQVLGRAGRGDEPGRVVIQTLAPDHYAIARAVAHDYAGFCAEELQYRKDIGYPPFRHLATIQLSGVAVDGVARAAAAVRELAGEIKREGQYRVEILGPSPAPLAKIRGRHRWQILLKAEERGALHLLLKRLRPRIKLPATIRFALDIDPVDMM